MIHSILETAKDHWLVIVAIIWAIGIPVAYFCYMRKSKTASKFDKIWLSCFWPLLFPLRIIHYFHNREWEKKES